MLGCTRPEEFEDNNMSLLSACRQTARRTFRIPRLRPEQESAMLAVLNGRDALVALPTGFGKSLIYQVPAMILERPTIVISPLIALMADQEHALKRCGVPVVALHSRLRAAERRSCARAAQKRRPPRRSHDARDARVGRHCTPVRTRAAGPPVHRRGPLHLGVGARLPALLPAPRRRPQAPGQSAGACPYGNGDPTRPGGHRRTASPGQTPGARRTGSPPEPSPDRRHCAWFREVPRRRPAHQGPATTGDHLLRHDHRGR